jgi:hypothetical protein
MSLPVGASFFPSLSYTCAKEFIEPIADSLRYTVKVAGMRTIAAQAILRHRVPAATAAPKIERKPKSHAAREVASSSGTRDGWLRGDGRYPRRRRLRSVWSLT